MVPLAANCEDECTAAGTLLVKDSFLGPSSSFASGTTVSSLTNANGKLLFAAAADGPGCANANVAAAPVPPQRPNAQPVWYGQPPIVLHWKAILVCQHEWNCLLRSSSGAPDGRDLWKTNGTAGGTVLVKHLGGARIQPATLVNMAGILYFVTNEANDVNKLWKSDERRLGTVVVKDSISKPTSDWTVCC